MFLTGKKPFFVIILLSAATTVSAAPTVTADGFIAPVTQMELDTPVLVVPTGQVVGSVDAKLVNLGKEFLQPPTKCAVLGDVHGDNVRPLPAVPAAVLMVLSGFLCVSLIRERRIWLAVLAGLLWAGHAGIQALPQLALRLGHANHKKYQLCAELACPKYLGNSHRLRDDIDGTQYIGLLRHLGGMPDGKSRYLHKYTHASQPAIILAETGLSPFCVRLVSRTRQFSSFSPAFVFSSLPRGPPIRA